MIKMSVLYSNFAGASFDYKYYGEEHLQLLKELLGDSLLKVEVDYGIVGESETVKPKYLVMGHLYFESIQEFQFSFLPHAEVIQNDVRNYTNIEPVIQISETRNI